MYRANEEVLARLGGTGSILRRLRRASRPRVGNTDPARRAEPLVGHADGATIIVKDPRIDVLLPLWGDILSGRLHPVLVIRDPTKIAQSSSLRAGATDRS